MQLSGLSLIKAKHNLKMFVINCSEYELLSFIKVNTFVIEYSNRHDDINGQYKQMYSLFKNSTHKKYFPLKSKGTE